MGKWKWQFVCTLVLKNRTFTQSFIDKTHVFFWYTVYMCVCVCVCVCLVYLWKLIAHQLSMKWNHETISHNGFVTDYWKLCRCGLWCEQHKPVALRCVFTMAKSQVVGGAAVSNVSAWPSQLDSEGHRGCAPLKQASTQILASLGRGIQQSVSQSIHGWSFCHLASSVPEWRLIHDGSWVTDVCQPIKRKHPELIIFSSSCVVVSVFLFGIADFKWQLICMHFGVLSNLWCGCCVCVCH